MLEGRQLNWRGLAWLCTAILLLASLRPVEAAETSAASAPVQDGAGADWEQIWADGPVNQLFTPASGALFARAGGLLFRSDDGGATWQSVHHPPEPRSDRPIRMTLDPANHTRLLATGAEGLYLSTDDAASWTLTLPTNEAVAALAISPADPQLLFVALVSSPVVAEGYRLLRSQDGGASWVELDNQTGSLCGFGVRILQPHPLDPARVFRTADCYAGRNLGDDLDQSLDRGQTWSTLFRPNMAYPSRLVGPASSQPARFYLAVQNDFRSGGSSVFRTDNDGASWSEVLAYQGGGTIQQPGQTPGPNVQIGGLTFDPTAPERVYVGLREGGSGVQASADAGQSWAPLGQQELGPINDLALGIDARNLYAATDQGLWRLALR